jgi:hypothetical protein
LQTGVWVLENTVTTQTQTALTCARTGVIGRTLNESYDGGGVGLLPSKSIDEYDVYGVRCVAADGREFLTTESVFSKELSTKFYGWGEKMP